MRGHVTGHVLCGRRELQRDSGTHNSLSRSRDLAKLNPNCHMNYSTIFILNILNILAYQVL